MQALDIMSEIESQITGEKIETKGCFGSIIFDPADPECVGCEYCVDCEKVVEATRYQQMADIDEQIHMVQQAILADEEQAVEAKEDYVWVDLPEVDPVEEDEDVAESNVGVVHEADQLSRHFAKRFRMFYADIFVHLLQEKRGTYDSNLHLVEVHCYGTDYKPKFVLRQKVMPLLVKKGLVDWQKGSQLVEWL